MDINFPDELQKQFEQAVVSGELVKGQIIHLDALAKDFETTQSAMNRVLNAEHRKGLVKRENDSQFLVLGIAQPSIDSVFQHTAKSGLSPTSNVRAVDVVPAAEAVAAQLKVNVGDPVYRQIRTRNVKDDAVANQCNYIPVEVCPGLEKVDLFRTSFQVTLEQKFLAIISHIEEKFALIPATEEDVQILSIPSNAQILNVQRLSLSINKEPLVWADIHIRTDRYPYVSQLWPQAAKLLEPK